MAAGPAHVRLVCAGGSAGSGVAAAMATRWAMSGRRPEGREEKKEGKLTCGIIRGGSETPSWSSLFLTEFVIKNESG